jgi:hypothetical protein
MFVLLDLEDERVTRVQKGRPVRKSDNKMRPEHLLPLLAGKYTWQNLRLLGFPHKYIYSYFAVCCKFAPIV